MNLTQKQVSLNCGASKKRIPVQCDGSLTRAATASHRRKLVPANGKFERAGWNPFERPAETD
jgi:hypothetical protein